MDENVCFLQFQNSRGRRFSGKTETMGSICSKNNAAESSKKKEKKHQSEKVADLENTLADGTLCFLALNDSCSSPEDSCPHEIERAR